MSTVTSAVINVPGMPGAYIGTVSIVSIYPREKRHIIPVVTRKPADELLGKHESPVRAITEYVLPAAERGSWTRIEIEDGYQYLRDLTGLSEENPTPGMIPTFQPARLIADALVNFWTGHTVGQSGRPGISVWPSGTEPTKDFLAGLEAQQTVFARGLVQAANDLDKQGKQAHITETHRDLAAWLYGTGAQRLPWFPKAVFEELKPCPGCGMEIKSAATRCKECGLDLIDWYKKYNVDPSGDPAIAKILSNLPNSPETASASTLKEVNPTFHSGPIETPAAVEQKAAEGEEEPWGEDGGQGEEREKTLSQMTKGERKALVLKRMDENRK